MADTILQSLDEKYQGAHPGVHFSAWQVWFAQAPPRRRRGSTGSQ